MSDTKTVGIAKQVAPVTPDDWKPKASQVWTITDKDYNELCRISSDVHIFITKDEHFVTVDTPSSYYEFDCVTQHEFAQYVEVGNHIIFEDDENYVHDMTMRKVTFDTKSVRTRVYCENGGMDLNNEFAGSFPAPAQPQTLSWYLNSARNPLYDSPIKITVNELSEQKRILSNDSNDTRQLQRLITLTNAFGGAEYRLHAKLANGGRTLPVLQQNLELRKRLGYDIANTFLIDDYNLKQLTAESDITELSTAICPLGSEKDGVVTDITSIVYDDGIYWSPQGDNFIYNRQARDEWSYLRDLQGKDKRGYIVRRYSYDTDDKQTLFNRALTELKKYDHLTTAYEATGRIMSARLGDTIMIATHKTPKPIYLKSRVIQKKISYVNEHATQYILGQFQVQVSNMSRKLQDLQETVNLAVSRYTWIRYANDASGGGMSSFPAGKKYIGIAYNMPTAVASDNPNDYTWSKFVGEDGHQGVDGKDGTTKYMWLKYADNIQGGGMSDDPNGKLYIGFAYNKDTPTESNKPQDYSWSAMYDEDALEEIQKKVDSIVYSVTSISEPKNPVVGQAWWRQDANDTDKIIGYFVWDGKKWQPQTVQQSILNIIELNAVKIYGSEITGTTINGSKFTNTFSYELTSGAKVTGVFNIENGAISFEAVDTLGYKYNYQMDSKRGVISRTEDVNGDYQSGNLGNGVLTLFRKQGSEIIGGSLTADALDPKEWINVKYQVGFTTAESNPCQYRIINLIDGTKELQLRGQVKPTSGNFPTGGSPSVAILPTEARPSRNELLMVADSTKKGARVGVLASGVIQVAAVNGSSYVALGGIRITL